MEKLKFRIRGTMQGFGSEGGTRVYHPCSIKPSSQSIVGLLSAALGYKRNSKEIDNLKERVNVEVDIENRGTFFTDYQGVHHYRSYDYDKKGSKIKNEMKTADGKSYNGPVVTKEYRSSVSYIVTILGQDDVLLSIKNALEKPYYPLYLGKACCLGRIDLLEEKV